LSGENEFTPRLGRIRDLGAGSAKSLRARVSKAAARIGQPGKGARFSGRNIGRGNGAVPQAKRGVRRIARMRMRRVIVKVHIARARGGGGARAFGEHVRYVQRDGVERDGSGGQIYGREGQEIDSRSFVERSDDDRHQFRLTLSAEDANALGDLKPITRALMAQMEQDLGTRLDWVAVDHHNTGHSHTHIIIRGKDHLGKDLIIARNYLTGGIRGRAQQIVTNELGPRRDLEIAQAQQAEVTKDRYTGLDRELADMVASSRFEIEPAAGAADRYRRSLHLQRLKHLEALHLATREGKGRWRLKEGWDRALKAMGRRGDIVRGLAAGLAAGETARGMRLFEERPLDARPLTGVVISQGPDDELRDTRFLLVEDLDGTRWAVSARGIEPGGLPPRGAVIEVSAAPRQARASDRVIADIAARNNGHYSEGLHAAADPSASRNFREAHKRRLEALRRAGLVTRQANGVWEIGEDYLQRAAEFEASRGDGVKIQVRSWMALETQIEARAETWLDSSMVVANEPTRGRIGKARAARQVFLERKGFEMEDGALTQNARDKLRMDELRSAGQRESKRSGRVEIALSSGETFEGTFERTVDLAQGRLAIIGKKRAFALLPWRPDLERQRGRSMVIMARERGISWTLPSGRNRGLGR
jgi:type IV secretory pathway VirD2 relaxase